MLEEAGFKENVLDAKIPVLVNFWSPQNEGSVANTSTLEELVSNKEGKVKLVKVDINRNQSLAEKYNITTVPSVLFFQDGKMLDKIYGTFNENDIMEKIAYTFTES